MSGLLDYLQNIEVKTNREICLQWRLEFWPISQTDSRQQLSAYCCGCNVYNLVF